MDPTLARDLALIRTALNWCGCLDERYADRMEEAGIAADEALERIVDRLGVKRDD